MNMRKGLPPVNLMVIDTIRKRISLPISKLSQKNDRVRLLCSSEVKLPAGYDM